LHYLFNDFRLIFHADSNTMDTPSTNREFKFSPSGSSTSGGNIAPIRGSFGSIRNTNTPAQAFESFSNTPAIEPISTLLQSNPDLGNMNWQMWDRTILQYNDPNTLPLDWSAEMPNFDFNDISAIDSDAWLANGQTLDGWSNSMNFQ
jgi:hypothetical protein